MIMNLKLTSNVKIIIIEGLGRVEICLFSMKLDQCRNNCQKFINKISL